jgi:hypothetical protein
MHWSAGPNHATSAVLNQSSSQRSQSGSSSSLAFSRSYEPRYPLGARLVASITALMSPWASQVEA